jgi:hypothetical protein
MLIRDHLPIVHDISTRLRHKLSAARSSDRYRRHHGTSGLPRTLSVATPARPSADFSSGYGLPVRPFPDIAVPVVRRGSSSRRTEDDSKIGPGIHRWVGETNHTKHVHTGLDSDWDSGAKVGRCAQSRERARTQNCLNRVSAKPVNRLLESPGCDVCSSMRIISHQHPD